MDTSKKFNYFLEKANKSNHSVKKHVRISSSHAGEWDDIEYGAEVGDADAQYLMGERYSEGEDGYPEDMQSTASWYKKAAEQGNSDAMIEFGKIYLDEGHYTLAEKWLRVVAEEGYNNEAYYWLGECLREQERYNEALIWYENGFKIGDEWCAEMVGWCYYNGLGVKEDKTKAINIFKRLVSKDPHKYLLATSSMGEHYWKEVGYLGKAIDLLSICAEEGLKDGGCTHQMVQLGLIYRGNNAFQDYAKARKWFQHAKELGNIRALVCLGVMEELGEGGKIDMEKAKKLFLKAAEEGEEQGMCFLADVLWEEGKRSEAMVWYRKSADAGYEDAEKYLRR